MADNHGGIQTVAHIMKRRHSGYIAVALLLTFCSQVGYYVSVLSEGWVGTEAIKDCCGDAYLIKYGLFRGSIVQVRDNLILESTDLFGK